MKKRIPIPKKKKKDSIVAVRFDSEMKGRITRLARKVDSSFSKTVRDLCAYAIGDFEDSFFLR